MRSPTMERLSGVRVLLVEDFAVLRQLIRWMLEREGAVIAEAGTGREALELATTQSLDIAVTDLGLPDMSGEDVIAGIRSAAQGRIPVVVLSGAGEDDLVHAVEVGAERAFRKPAELDQLIKFLEHRTTGARALAATARNGGTELTLLVVEDDDAMRALLRDVLERAGYRVIERPDGIGLTELAEHADFDAVVLDKEMPSGPNGLDLLAFLHMRFPSLPVIFVTAFGGPDVEREALRRGAHTYLEKPFRVAAILDTLTAVVGHGGGGEGGR